MAATTPALVNSRYCAPPYRKSRQNNFESFRACARRKPCHRLTKLSDQPAQHIQAAQYVIGLVSCSSFSRRRSGVACATLQGGLVSDTRNDGGARQLITWVSELPRTRVAVWVTVALTALQFQDFFGVNSPAASSAANLPVLCSVLTPVQPDFTRGVRCLFMLLCSCLHQPPKACSISPRHPVHFTTTV